MASTKRRYSKPAWVWSVAHYQADSYAVPV